MKAKTELLLYRLMWLADKAIQPYFFNLEQSFEGWAYRNGLLTMIQRLEAQGLLEATQDPKSGKRLHRLTEAGRAAALPRRDPEISWSAPWDRKWRLFFFDIPVVEGPKRKKLTRALAKAGCGCLQGSVWIAPTTPPAVEKIIAEDDPDCTHLLLLQADSKGPKVDAKMVEGAWDFDAINDAYGDLETVLERFSDVAGVGTKDALERWTADEQIAVTAALRLDPLLPAVLLPKRYAGRKVWKKRGAVLARAGRLAKSLSA